MLILTNVLECSETDAGLVLFTDLGPANPIRVARSDLIEAFRASAQCAEAAVNIFVASRVLALLPAGGNTSEVDATIDIDLSDFPWQSVVQGIVARSTDLREVTVIQWMNHPSQRPDSYGASVSLITAKAIHHATSEDLLAGFRQQDKGLSPKTSRFALPTDAGVFDNGTATDRLEVKELETALCIWESMLYFRGLHQDGRPVPNNIVRMSELWDAVGWQPMRLRVRALVPFALDVYDDLFEDLKEEGFTFDFDFAPAFVETLLWSQDGAHREGELEDFLEQVMTAVRRHRGDIVAQSASSLDRVPTESPHAEDGDMALFKATLELLVDVDCETEASDCIAETLREQLRKFSPGSPLIDWRYAGVDGEPSPHDGRGFEYPCRPPQK